MKPTRLNALLKCTDVKFRYACRQGTAEEFLQSRTAASLHASSPHSVMQLRFALLLDTWNSNQVVKHDPGQHNSG